MNTIIPAESFTSPEVRFFNSFEYLKQLIFQQLHGEYPREITTKVLHIVKEEFEKMIPDLPYFGGKRDPYTQLALLSAVSLVIFMALKIVLKNNKLARTTTLAIIAAYTNSSPNIPGKEAAAWIFWDIYYRWFDKTLVSI